MFVCGFRQTIDAAIAGAGLDAHCIVPYIFVVADPDPSGTRSPAEYSAAGLERYGANFAESDAAGDGDTAPAGSLELSEQHHPGTDRVAL